MREIAIDETVADESFLNIVDSTDNPRICRWQKAHEREHEQAGIRLARPVILHERVDFCIEAVSADLIVNLLAKLAPTIGIAGQTKRFRKPHRTVRGHPRHDLPMRELPLRTAH